MGCVPFGSFDAKERTIENHVICSSLQTFQLKFQDAFCHQLLADISQIFRFMIQQLHLLWAVLCCCDLRGALDKLVSIQVFTGIMMQSGRRSSAVCGGNPQGTQLSFEALLSTYKNSAAKSPECGGPGVAIRQLFWFFLVSCNKYYFISLILCNVLCFPDIFQLLSLFTL